MIALLVSSVWEYLNMAPASAPDCDHSSILSFGYSFAHAYRNGIFCDVLDYFPQ